ncbi:hypothetical protein SAMN04489726_3658 [Allokutzneria albata]|uniref:Uncharacterized protein n=2 Tax=Allokutzneria albata TaxID=211114 RepID=A0A1G9WK45_ALLAB|nr:hypothetical protein SAMN04489726_3658 [Allokutzneria albata]
MGALRHPVQRFTKPFNSDGELVDSHFHLGQRSLNYPHNLFY